MKEEFASKITSL
jgi:hypothetical protein